MSVIQITPAEVQSTGQDFRNKRAEVDALTARADTLIQRLRDSFKGQRAERIYTEWSNIFPSLKKATEQLEVAGNLLTRAAEAFEQVDSGL